MQGETRDSIFKSLNQELGADDERTKRFRSGIIETWRTLDVLAERLGAMHDLLESKEGTGGR